MDLELNMIERVANKRRQLKNLEIQIIETALSHLLDIEDDYYRDWYEKDE